MTGVRITAMLLAAWALPVSASDREFGATVRKNLETQVIDWDPVYEGTLQPGGIGKRSGDSVRRYMTDRIRPLLQSNLKPAVGSQGGASATSGSAGAAGAGN